MNKSNRMRLWRRNCKCVRANWGKLDSQAMAQLKSLTTRYRLSLAVGEIQLLDNRWYITHSGLISLAQRKGCRGITTVAVKHLCDPASQRWVFKATVYGFSGSSGFVGYGDADPSNTSALARGAEMRMAETRAVNRALRRALGIGLCSVEEVSSHSSFDPNKQTNPANRNGLSNGQPRLRDKLCLLIRRYELDPNLVKRYAADFCGTETLRDASRDLVEAFVSTVAKEAANDRAGLVCKLNSYCQPEEVRP
jgi:hypothetical protein